MHAYTDSLLFHLYNSGKQKTTSINPSWISRHDGDGIDHRVVVVHEEDEVLLLAAVVVLTILFECCASRLERHDRFPPFPVEGHSVRVGHDDIVPIAANGVTIVGTTKSRPRE